MRKILPALAALVVSVGGYTSCKIERPAEMYPEDLVSRAD